MIPFPFQTYQEQIGLQQKCCLLFQGCGLTADRLAQLVEHRTAVREVEGSNLGRTNTQGL